MKAHEQRVIEEKNELGIKIERLNNFLKTELYNGLPHEEKTRLSSQSVYMENYYKVLCERIEAFETTGE